MACIVRTNVVVSQMVLGDEQTTRQTDSISDDRATDSEDDRKLRYISGLVQDCKWEIFELSKTEKN